MLPHREKRVPTSGMLRPLSAIVLMLFLVKTFSGEAAAHEFKLYDGTLYLEKPEGLGCGFEPAHVIFEHLSGVEVRGRSFSVIEETFARAVERARADGSQWVILDIERIPPATWDLARDIAWLFKAHIGDKKLGYYDVLPCVRYWDVLGNRKPPECGGNPDGLERLIRVVDGVFPSLYVYYDDLDGWGRYATEKIVTAKRLGRPTYPFVWPQFHDSNKTLGRQFLGESQWEKVLDVVMQHADGLVLWGGWEDAEGRRLVWDSGAPWWKVLARRVLQQKWRKTCAIK